jgi:hypothetical protein
MNARQPMLVDLLPFGINMIVVDARELPHLLVKAIDTHDEQAIPVIAKAMLACAEAIGGEWKIV